MSCCSKNFMNKIDLSIIISSYNTKKITLDLISSIVKHQPKCKFEIIVVDDFSNDGSIELLKKNKNIRLFINNSNLGYVRTNNKGIANAKGEYILLLNSDTLVTEDSIQSLYEFAKSKTDAGVVGGQLLNIDGTIQASCYNLPSVLNTVFGKDEKFYPIKNGSCLVDGVVGAVFMITPKAIIKAGLLNEKYKSYFEDIDYCRKVKRVGLKVYYFADAKFYHYHGESFKKLSDEKDQWKKLIPSSKIYNGLFVHYTIFLIMWIRQKFKKLFNFFTVTN